MHTKKSFAVICSLLTLTLTLVLFVHAYNENGINRIMSNNPRYQVFADSFNVDNWPNHYGPTRTPQKFESVFGQFGLSLESSSFGTKSLRYKFTNDMEVSIRYFNSTYLNQMNMFVNSVPPGGDTFRGFDTTQVYWDIGFNRISTNVAGLGGSVDNYYISIYSDDSIDSILFCNLFTGISQQIRNAPVIDSLEVSPTIPRLAYFSLPDSFQQDWRFVLESMEIKFLMNNQDEIYELDAHAEADTRFGTGLLHQENLTTNDTLIVRMDCDMREASYLRFSVSAGNIRGELFDTTMTIYTNE